MKRFRVYATVTGGWYMGEFEAETKEQAIEKAHAEEGDWPTFCHQCSDYCEDSQVTQVEAEEA